MGLTARFEGEGRKRERRGTDSPGLHSGEKPTDTKISNHCQKPEAEEKLLLGTLTLAYLHTF